METAADCDAEAGALVWAEHFLFFFFPRLRLRRCTTDEADADSDDHEGNEGGADMLLRHGFGLRVMIVWVTPGEERAHHSHTHTTVVAASTITNAHAMQQPKDLEQQLREWLLPLRPGVTLVQPAATTQLGDFTLLDESDPVAVQDSRGPSVRTKQPTKPLRLLPFSLDGGLEISVRRASDGTFIHEDETQDLWQQWLTCCKQLAFPCDNPATRSTMRAGWRRRVDEWNRRAFARKQPMKLLVYVCQLALKNYRHTMHMLR
jgi:hypothetical protein